MVAAVEKGLADFSFNLLLTGQREEAIDFTVPYQGISCKFQAEEFCIGYFLI